MMGLASATVIFFFSAFLPPLVSLDSFMISNTGFELSRLTDGLSEPETTKKSPKMSQEYHQKYQNYHRNITKNITYQTQKTRRSIEEFSVAVTAKYGLCQINLIFQSWVIIFLKTRLNGVVRYKYLISSLIVRYA